MIITEKTARSRCHKKYITRLQLSENQQYLKISKIQIFVTRTTRYEELTKERKEKNERLPPLKGEKNGRRQSNTSNHHPTGPYNSTNLIALSEYLSFRFIKRSTKTLYIYRNYRLDTAVTRNQDLRSRPDQVNGKTTKSRLQLLNRQISYDLDGNKNNNKKKEQCIPSNAGLVGLGEMASATDNVTIRPGWLVGIFI